MQTITVAYTPRSVRVIFILLTLRRWCPGDAVDGAGLGTWGRFDLFPVFGIERFRHAQRGIARHAVARRHLVDERILFGDDKVRHRVARRSSLVRRDARRTDRRQLRGLQLEALG